MAGLVCDVGQLILGSAPATDGPDSSQADAITHAEVGAFLLGLWGLPFRIVEAVANHHAPLTQCARSLGPAADRLAGLLLGLRRGARSGVPETHRSG